MARNSLSEALHHRRCAGHGTAIVGRLADGHIPPVDGRGRSLRWFFRIFIILPYPPGGNICTRDWGCDRNSLGTMIVSSPLIGISAVKNPEYWALEHTQGLNTLLLLAVGGTAVRCKVVVAICSGVQLTWRRPRHRACVADRVLVIRPAGDLPAIQQARIQNGRHHLQPCRIGDLRVYSVAVAVNASAESGLSLVGFTFG